MISRQTSLSGNIVQFCRWLRLKGFSLSAEEESTALNALHFIDYSTKDIFRQALKSVCCKSISQLHDFDNLFNLFWKEIGEAEDAKTKSQGRPSLNTGTNVSPFKTLKSWLNGDQNKEIEKTALYSAHESLSQKDFATVPDDEVEELMRGIKALSKRLAAHISRRYEKNNRVNLPDLRLTLRRNLRRGGELLEIAYRKPKRNRTKLVILCDVSKSMDLYATFLLQFMYAFQHVYHRMETFAFSTSLQCITQVLKQNDFGESMRFLSAQNRGWSGGTRIGESLLSFLNDYGRRALDKRTIVIIMSDGWDTGDISLLEHSMEIIHKRSKKVIWLNPLAGYADYQPDVAGMKAAMTHIDIFAPVHNAESLRKLGKWF